MPGTLSKPILWIAGSRWSRLLFVFTCVSFVATSGCGIFIANVTEYDKNVSNQNDLWGGYKRDAVYTTAIDSFLESEEDYKKKIVLVPPKPHGELHWLAPRAEAEYRANPAKWPQVLDVVPAGTQIKVLRIEKHGAALVGSSLQVVGVIQNGPHQGKEVDITDMSAFVRGSSNPVLHKPDPTLLVEVMHKD